MPHKHFTDHQKVCERSKFIIEVLKLFFLSWLTKIEDFKFEYSPRDPSLLPKEYVAKQGETCYFIDGYKHKGIEGEIQKHIDAAMQQINAELEH